MSIRGFGVSGRKQGTRRVTERKGEIVTLVRMKREDYWRIGEEIDAMSVRLRSDLISAEARNREETALEEADAEAARLEVVFCHPEQFGTVEGTQV